MMIHRYLKLLPFCILALVVASACGRREQVPLQEEVDYSLVGDLFSSPSGASAVPAPDTVLATVQGQPITQADLQRETSILLMTRRGQLQQPEALAAEAQRLADPAFQNLIRKALLVDAAGTEDIQVTDEEIATQLEAVKNQLPEGQDWEAALVSQNLDDATVREQLSLSLRVDKLLKSLTADLDAVPAEDIEAIYQANTNSFVQPELAEFSHILFRVAPDATEKAVDEVKQRATQYRAVAGNEVEFEPLAAKLSEDEVTKDKGGYVGKFARAQLPPELGAIVFTTEPGEIGEVVRTPIGFHIIRVESLEAPRLLTLDEVSHSISNRIAQQRSQEKLAAYLEELREAADVEIVGPLPTGVQP